MDSNDIKKYRSILESFDQKVQDLNEGRGHLNNTIDIEFAFKDHDGYELWVGDFTIEVSGDYIEGHPSSYHSPGEGNEITITGLTMNGHAFCVANAYSETISKYIDENPEDFIDPEGDYADYRYEDKYKM